MKNNKGFSLVELLGVVTILGILMMIGIAAYSKYIDSSKNKAYKTLRNSAISAMDNYLLENPDKEEATFTTLVEEQYLERATDPSDKTKQCRGKVILENPDEEGTGNELATNNYKVIICCANYKHTYTTADKEDHNDENKCALD